ncbi:MAG: MopE-related protein, partial [Myxococcota bacterium]|nr:MopE-related protein [Myxococcota bacterium]
MAALGGGSTSPSNILINQSTFSGNTAKTYGGAVSVGSPYNQSKHGSLTVTGSSFSSNTALSSQSGVGGAIYHNADSIYSLNVTQSHFTDNLAEISGGAIYAAYLGDADISLSQFHNNSASGLSNVYDRYGGAVMIADVSDVVLSNSWLCGNETQNTNGNNSGYGGGFYAQNSADLLITNTYFTNNISSDFGGAWALYNNASIDIAHVTAVENSGVTGGVGWYELSSPGVLNSIFAYNTGLTMVASDSSSSSGSSFSYSNWHQNSLGDSGGLFNFSTTSNGNTTVSPSFLSYSQDGNCNNDNLALDSTSALDTAANDGGAIGATGGSALIDDDGDGISGLFDCDDNDAQAYPGAAPNDSSTACMVDSDGDGYGDTNPTSSFADPGTDCDDSAPLVNPGSPEICDGLDNDCSGLVDDNPINGQFWYPDL